MATPDAQELLLRERGQKRGSEFREFPVREGIVLDTLNGAVTVNIWRAENWRLPGGPNNRFGGIRIST